MLEAECRNAGVTILTGIPVTEIRKESVFQVKTGDREFHAPALVIATGGLSIPKIGATAFGYEVARQFGLNIQPCRPALVPLTFDPEDRKRYCDLAGVSADVIASCDSRQFRDKMLVTHRGLSGPAILQISSYWERSMPLIIDLAPGRQWTAPLLKPRGRRDLMSARTLLRTVMPARFADRWLDLHPPKDWTNASITELEKISHCWQFVPSGTEGYEKAEVTAGGVDTNELSAKTMESRKVPGLYFVGEVVDVTGHLGGFNFQWAWASGYCAGLAI
jgi:predicted Rossmann fold flavoprotein